MTERSDNKPYITAGERRAFGRGFMVGYDGRPAKCNSKDYWYRHFWLEGWLQGKDKWEKKNNQKTSHQIPLMMSFERGDK